MKRRLVFPAASLALAPVWYLGLLVPPDTREFLTRSAWWNFDLRPFEMALAVCAACLLTALLLRRWLAGGGTRRVILLGAIWPLVMSVLFTWAVVATGTFPFHRLGIDPGRPVHAHGLDELPAFFGILPLYGLLYVVSGAYVLIPLGVGSVWILRRLVRSAARAAPPA